MFSLIKTYLGFCKTIYLLQLPNIVKSKEDIKIVYNHLNKLFKCAFKSSVFEDFIFNPELIELLFENAPKQFYSQNCWLFLDCNVGDHLKFALNHLIITDYMQLSFRPDKDKTKTINILSSILMNGDKFKGVRLTSNKFFDLFDFAMNVSFGVLVLSLSQVRKGFFANFVLPSSFFSLLEN
ncbi:unnamed protein product [Meloidogyne enterolobii]|uniref:Uncharacterized protein n=1 Tax=Meloidogyne enterolobii TaxID=390850 RepID=A0ACB0ZCS7_MELEN